MTRSSRTLGLSPLLQRAILLASALAMLLFALPLAVSVAGLYRSQAMEELARDAERCRGVLTDAVLRTPDRIPALLPAAHDPVVQLGVYDGDGVLVAGEGPTTADPRTRHASTTGVEEQGVVDDVLVTAVPLNDDPDERARYVIRAAEPYSVVQRSTYITWGLMAALAVVVLSLVAAVGRSRARRIARPLQHLADAAAALGQGDFSVRATSGGVAEVDAVSLNLERTARRLGGMIERERAFSADASHQLRTPLTAVRVGLESALLTPGADLRGAANDALESLDRLEQTVLDLLALARDTRSDREATDVALLVGRSTTVWGRTLADAGRRLDLQLEPDLPAAGVSQAALRTVLDVLLDNALTHGQGTVRVGVRADEGSLVVDVGDEGSTISGDPARLFTRRSPEARGTGIGLALARSLIEADGGRLDLTQTRPTVFTAVLPVWRSDAAAQDDDEDDEHDGPGVNGVDGTDGVDRGVKGPGAGAPGYVEAGTRPGGS